MNLFRLKHAIWSKCKIEIGVVYDYYNKEYTNKIILI